MMRVSRDVSRMRAQLADLNEKIISASCTWTW